MTDATFVELQAKLREIWPTVTLRSIGDVERTVVVAHSISFDVPDHLVPVFPTYEERFLCLVLSLLRAPRSRVVYVSSQPIHPRVLDYYFALVPELDTIEARRRFFNVSLVDGRKVPLPGKILARPGLLSRLRDLVGDPEVAFILPYCMRNALLELRAAEDDLRGAIELEDPELSVEDYLEALDNEGGIVEERIEGDEFRSPSVQLRMSPAGQVDIMSTHDQVLGGPHGHTYFGCHFPADQEYAERIAAEALTVGRRLAREGVIGRAGLDFVAVKQENGWQPYALDVNLRCTGTTHTFWALQALSDGVYDPLAGEYRTRTGMLKHYAATDHLDSPQYESLTPDDLLDLVAERGLGWDTELQTGVCLHMVSALAVAGRIGLTAIGDTLDDARSRYYEVKAAVDEAASVTA